MNETIKLGKLEVNTGELAEFLAEAEKECYASERKPEILEDGSKKLFFKKFPFIYVDRWWGHYQRLGLILVRKNGLPVFGKNYSGGIIDRFWGNKHLAERIFSFREKALANLRIETGEFKHKDFPELAYFATEGCEEENNLFHFAKQEIITHKDREAFSLKYRGVLIVPK